MRTSARTWYALILFGFGVASLLFFKPRFMFREDGSMYEFGTGHDRSVFAFGTAVAALAVVASFVFAMGDLVMSGGEAPPPPPPPLPPPHPAPMRPPALGRPPAAFPPSSGGAAGGYLSDIADPFDLNGGFTI